MLDIRSKKVVKTRKAHTCAACLRDIDKGAEVVAVSAKEDDMNKRFHVHIECNIRIMKNGGYDDFKDGILTAAETEENLYKIYGMNDTELPF